MRATGQMDEIDQKNLFFMFSILGFSAWGLVETAGLFSIKCPLNDASSIQFIKRFLEV
jgi:hypothetical protein